MEYGPRALGARSILASPEYENINLKLNKRLKRSEFMPFAPVTLYEKAEEFGRFNLGSTVVILFPKSTNLDWSSSIESGQKVKFGECIAKVS